MDTQGVFDYIPPEQLREHWKFRGQWWEEIFEQLMLELKKYLLIKAELRRCGEDAVRYSPSDYIDQLWHHFILDNTAEYQAFCERFLGGFVHHKAGNQNFDLEVMKATAKKLGFSLVEVYWAEDPCTICG